MDIDRRFSYLGTLSVILSALCPPAPLKSLTFWRYTNQIIINLLLLLYQAYSIKFKVYNK